MAKKRTRKAPAAPAVKRRSFSLSGFADDQTNEREIPAITKLWVKGWKSLSELTSIDLRGLTILAGANSSGKSSFFQPILMLKQTLEAPYDPGALLLDGPHVRFTETSQFLSQSPRAQERSELLIGLATKENLVETQYLKAPDQPIEVTAERFGVHPDQMFIRADMSAGELASQLGNEGMDLLKVFGGNSKTTQLSVKRNRCFLSVQLTVDRGPGQQLALVVDNNQSGEVIQAIRSIIHLPGLRGNPARTYPLNATEGLYSGPFQNYTASLIQLWKEPRSKHKLTQLNQALIDLGLTSEITTTPVDETRVEIKVGRLLGTKENDFVSIADVGLAVSQVLPVLVALVVAKSGQLVFVEQPELHLHPRAQVRLAGIIAGAVKRGVRVLLETHSSLLILGIQTAVAEKILPAEDVALHWFTRDDSGTTCVSHAELDSSGAFGDLPMDFADVSLEAEVNYINAAEKVLLAERDAR